MKLSSLASILAATLSAGGAIAGYLFFKPSNLENYLKWKGLQLATDSENLWKSIYEENKDEFSSAFPNTEETEALNAIKKYCNKAIKKGDYYSEIDKASKWCIDNVQTVRGQMVKEGMEIKDLMTSSEEFQVAAAVQANTEFWTLVGATDDTLKTKTEAYKRWCKNSLDEKPNSNLVQNVNTFCHRKKYTNFKTRLSTEEYERISGNDQIDKKYSELKLESLQNYTGSNTLEILGGGAATWTDKFGIEKNKWNISKEKFREVFENYCKELDENKFQDDNYADLYSKYKGICAKPKASKP